MRSADRSWRLVLLAALGAAVSGCASMSAPFDAIQQAISPSTIAAKPAAPVVVDAPVNPAVQRAFDDAGRLLRAGRTEEAERAFRALAAANPQLGGPHANLGVIHRQGGKLTESAADLEQAVKLGPTQPIYFNQLGITYRQLGQFDKAKDAYEKAMALNAEYASPCLNLAILNDLYLGDAKRALELYDRYLALSPSGDAVVSKWVVDLKNRKPAPITVSRKEKA